MHTTKQLDFAGITAKIADNITGVVTVLGPSKV
jgi:hypothetical protein